MTLAVGLLNIALGAVYLAIGVMTWMDLVRGWRTRGPSHFGLAFLFLAFTCGPHHVDHGLHVMLEDIPGGILDLTAVVIGIPAGLVWFLLRIESARGGHGDRAISREAPWVTAIPMALAMYAIGMATAGAAVLAVGSRFEPALVPNLLLVALYSAIGIRLTRAQLAGHARGLPWSLSGISLAAVFPTCAFMHASYVVYDAAGQYVYEPHLFTIDVVSVPAAAYFLWVVWALGRGELTDWNVSTRDAQPLAPEEMAQQEIPLDEPVAMGTIEVG